ncbi:uncharacterized protein DMAD_06450 [Drosophila madeirensis]|uniref:Uncharacterized protein n=1 Tax=Drosophila madeirensis TaxID=30013 RepID=A0AAU9FQJ1_DROMD
MPKISNDNETMVASYTDENRSVQQIVEDTLRAGDAEVLKIVNETLKSAQVHRHLGHVMDQFESEDERSVEQIVEETLKSVKVDSVAPREEKVSPNKVEEAEPKEVRPIAYFVNLDDEQKVAGPAKKTLVKTQQKKVAAKAETPKGRTVRETTTKSTARSSISRRPVGDKEKPKSEVKAQSTTQPKQKKKIAKQTVTRKTSAAEKVPKVAAKSEPRRSVTSSVSTTSSASATSRVISELHFERSASPAASSIFYESHPQGDGSRSSTPRPRVKTDVTRIPYNASIRSLSPTSKSTKTATAKVTAAATKKTKTTTTTRSSKELTGKTASKIGSQEHVETRRMITPTPIATHRYMQPTLSHNMRYGLSGDAEGHRISPVPAKSPAPPKSNPPYRTQTSVTSALTKSTYLERKQNKSIGEKVQPKRGSQSDSKESLKSTERLYKRQTSKENKLTLVIGSQSQATKSMKTQSASVTKTIAQRTSIETDNRHAAASLQKKKAPPATASATLQRTKVPVSASSSMTRTAAAKLTGRSDETAKKPQIEVKKTVKRTASSSSSSTAAAIRTVQSSIEPKLQKKMKDNMNESSSNSGSTSASGSSNSTRRSVRSVTVSRKTDKEMANLKLSSEKKREPSTSSSASASASTSTVRVHREPTATTAAVSTVLVDDDCEVITIRSIKSSDSTKSSTSSSSGSGSNSRKVLTSEVFTKTFGPDRPLEVVYRQPEFDVEHHTIMSVRPPSTTEQQRCINEFDVSFIDTTDSSLSDSVALPMFGPGEPERLLAASPGSPKPTRSPLALVEETLRRQQQHQYHHQQQQQQHHHSAVVAGPGAVLGAAALHVESGGSIVVETTQVEKSSTSKGKYGQAPDVRHFEHSKL